MRFYEIQVQINNPNEITEYLTELLILKAKATTRDKECFYMSIINELSEWHEFLNQNKNRGDTP